MFVDDFSGVDGAIEGARDNLDLTGMRGDHESKEMAGTYLAERAALEGTDAIQIFF